MLFYLLAGFLGILSGIFTGLLPGIHTNLLAAILISLSFSNPLTAVIFLTALAITHTFLDFIPSIYFGAPDESTALAVQPAHKQLLKGKAHETVYLTTIGSLSAVFILILITPFFIFSVPLIYLTIEKLMAFILIWISFLLIYTEKISKIQSLIIFILSGFLGFSTLNLNISQPLLPLLTGLFGTSTIILSIKNKPKIPKQFTKIKKIKKTTLLKPLIATTLISPICSFLPGLGSSQSAVISSQIIKQNQKQFFILLGSINTLVMSVSFLTLFLIQKSRTGIASAINQISQITHTELAIIFITIILTSIISFFLTINLSKKIANKIHKINYQKISIIILIFITIINIYFTSFSGLLILTSSTLLGITCTNLSVRKSFLMGSLLIPTIIFYLPI